MEAGSEKPSQKKMGVRHVKSRAYNNGGAEQAVRSIKEYL